MGSGNETVFGFRNVVSVSNGNGNYMKRSDTAGGLMNMKYTHSTDVHKDTKTNEQWLQRLSMTW